MKSKSDETLSDVIYRVDRESNYHGLKACPFCGDIPQCGPWHSAFKGSCDHKKCHVNPYVSGDTLEETINKWNQRKSNPR